MRGLLARLARSIPANAGQEAADAFLMSTAGGAAGAGIGAGLGGEDALVPGMLAGAASGAGARGLLRMLTRRRPPPGVLDDLAPEEMEMEIVQMFDPERGVMRNYLVPKKKGSSGGKGD